jgi:predicted short-subunit dehydrogenase-like oxidoreductase (DUF2520 family)
VALVGAGRAGGTLAVLLGAAGWRVRAICSRGAARARTVARRVGVVSASRPLTTIRPERAAAAAEIILLAVPDDALAGVARRLGLAGSRADGAVYLHLSGAAPLTVLDPLRRPGAHTGSLHPLAVLPSAKPPPDLLCGAGFAVEGDPTALACARRLARSLGGFPFTLPAEGRAAYHLAASLVANDTVALFQLALEQAQLAGLPPATARMALAHLLSGVARILTGERPARALTGPVSRGDVKTVQQHLEAARRGRPETRHLHLLLSRVLLRTARDAGRVSPAAARRMERLLDST